MAEKIKSLTPKQIDNIPKYVDKWLKIGLSTEPCNFEKAKIAAKEIYKEAGLEEPKHFFLFDCPVSAAIGEIEIEHKLSKKKGSPEITQSKIREKINNQIYGCHEASWLAFYDFFGTEVGLECCNRLKWLMELATHCGWWTPLKDVVIFQHRPKEIHFDEQNRLHHLNGPAIAYRGGKVNVWAVHGVVVTEGVITKNFTWQDIENEKNLEIRRVMINIYGQAKYLMDSGAKEVHRDDFGVLYQKEIPGDEALVMVKVANSTPEPDGTFKDYFIRVDPNAYNGIKTAQAAVASTWRRKNNSFLFANPTDYVCEVES